jgi:putative transposase
MPRQKRVLSPTQVYHVMVRGNSGRDIFLDNDDKQKLLRIIINKKRENQFILYAYCLMDNHFHLVLKECDDNISHIMKRINTTYVSYFNKKYQLNGHLFQDRFKSEIVESDAYLLALVRYVHNNPIKAGLVTFPKDYQWSSYLSYTTTNQKKVVNTEDILEIFSEDLLQARSQFIEFSQLREERYNFLDYKENNKYQKELNTDLKVKYFRDQFFKRNKLTLDLLSDRRNKALRDKLIQELKDKSVYSNREIAEFLNIRRGMVQQIRRGK